MSKLAIFYREESHTLQHLVEAQMMKMSSMLAMSMELLCATLHTVFSIIEKSI
jgi:hypothetical protein